MWYLLAGLPILGALLMLVIAVARGAKVLASAVLHVGNVLATLPAGGPADAGRMAQLEADLSGLRRELNDVDEKLESRFRRLTQRARRDELPATVEPEQAAIQWPGPSQNGHPQPPQPSRMIRAR